MAHDLWEFLKDAGNRAVFGWMGAGIVGVAGGLWAVVKFFAKKGESASKSGITAEGGSVVIAGANTDSPININTHRPGRD